MIKNSYSLLQLNERNTTEIISTLNELKEIDNNIFKELQETFQNQFARIIFLKTFAMLRTDCNLLKISVYNTIAKQIIFSQEKYEGEWKQKDISHIIFNSCTFTNIRFVGMKFTDVIFHQCHFFNCIFEDVVFSGCVFCESTQNMLFKNVQFINPSNYMYKLNKKIFPRKLEYFCHYCYNFINSCRIEENALIIDSEATQRNSFYMHQSEFLTINSVLIQHSRFKQNFYEFYYSKKYLSPLLLSANEISRSFFSRSFIHSCIDDTKSPYYIKTNKITLLE